MAKSRGNGQGSVTKIKDTKGKIKYQVRITVGSEFDAEKEKFRYISKSLGVYKTKAEAEAVLAEYNSSPYDLTNKIRSKRTTQFRRLHGNARDAKCLSYI